MTLYVFMFITLLLLSVGEVIYGNKKVVLIGGGLLSLLAGLRYYSGYDFAPYYSFFHDLTGIQDVFNGKIDAESGYLLLNYLFLKLGLNFYAFILFFAFLSMGLLINFLYRNAPYPSLILFYYFSRFFLARDMGQIRGSIASIILLYSVKYMKEKQLFKFLVVVFVASLFHITALIFIVGYLYENYLYDGSWKQLTFLFLLALTIGLIIQNPSLYLWAIPQRYAPYFTNPAYTSGKWLMNPVLWMQLLVFFGALLFTGIKKDSTYRTYHNLYFLASLSLIAFGNLATVGGRLSSPFATYEMFVAPYLILNFTKNKLVNLVLYLGFTVVIFLLIFVLSGDYVHFIPYDTLLN
ncbi:Hypothetical protein Tpal_2104 [Trichococcus palustris]|jgi:hypothetical protein|uniref:EpsG family protein n=1 Tax=Trichococcus palustris TaxID=140314 RepID=A0A143YRR9_9LACT|nr:EpsG family protein [Trichococcus palustris]CZQ97135.1 Hypothetical protein Tpal_2104 [Trichococcus palustris]SFK75545.1 EpsG family protein [Trichococcus palustris]